MKKSVYLAASLDTRENRVKNANWAAILQRKFTVYLPQRDGGLYIDLINHSGMTRVQAAEKVYLADIHALRACDYVVARLHSMDAVDPGVAMEIGYAAALHKSVVIVLPEHDDHADLLNPMLWQCARAVFTTPEFDAWLQAHE